MATRNNKFPAKSTRNVAKPVDVKPTVVDEPTVAETVATPEPKLHETASAYFDRMMKAIDDFAEASGAPSRNRLILGWFVSTFGAMLIGYGLGTLLSYAIIGALVLTGSAFLATMIYVLGMVAAIYASWNAGQWISNYIVTKEIDADYARVKLAAAGPIGFVKSFFVRAAGGSSTEPVGA
jgi:hypothetical protein